MFFCADAGMPIPLSTMSMRHFPGSETMLTMTVAFFFAGSLYLIAFDNRL